MAIEKKIVIDVDAVKAAGGIDKLTESLKETNKEVKETSASTQQMSNTVDKATGGAVSKFKALKGGLGGVIASFKTLRGAIIATGIGALIIAITSLTQAFTRSEEGQNKFAKILGVIGSVTGNLLDLLADLGEGIISVFEDPKQALINFKNLLVENITNRFKAILDTVGFLGSAIKNVFSGEFKAALDDAKKAGSSFVDSFTGVENSIDKATNAVKGFAKEIADDASAAAKIADQRAQAEKLARNLVVERAEAERKIAELREKAVNKDKFTAQERIKFLEEAGRVSDELAAKEIAVSQLRLEAKRTENALTKSNKEDLDEQARLEAEVIQKETQRLNLQKRLSTELLTSRREEAAAQKAIIDAENKRNEEAATKEQARLDAIDKIRNDFTDKQKQKEADEELEKITLEEEKKLAELDKLNASEEQKLEVLKYYAALRTDVEQKENDKKAELDKLRQQQTLGDAANTFGQISQLAGKDSKIGKALAVASATISGVQGVQNAYSTAQKSPITTFFPAYPVVQAALAGAVAAKNIAAIKSVDSSGKGGASVPTTTGGAASQPPSFNVVGATETSQLAEAVGGQSQQPVQAYVVANDVTTAQSLENNIVEGATL
jgi:hypothetical protein